MQSCTPPGSAGAKTQKKGSRMIRDVLYFLCMLAAVLSIKHFLFEPVRVKGSSMRPALSSGDWLFVSKLDYRLGDPARGDVVICHYPGRYADRWKLVRQYFVKRVIGLPGDTIAIAEGVVFINGEVLEERWLDESGRRSRRSMPERTLGPDEYFVMGDNRISSNDSRNIGPLKRSMIVGRVRRVVFPIRSRKRFTDR